MSKVQELVASMFAETVRRLARDEFERRLGPLHTDAYGRPVEPLLSELRQKLVDIAAEQARDDPEFREAVKRAIGVAIERLDAQAKG